MLDVRPQAIRYGGALCAFGGLLCIAGYFIPWVTFRIRVDGGAIVGVPINGWEPAQENPVCVAPALLPLLMGIAAVIVGSAAWRGVSRPLVRTLLGILVALGTCSFLVNMYALDPFGFNPDTLWVLQRQPSPLVGPGCYAMCAGILAIVVGGYLTRLSRKQALPAAAAS